MESCCYNTISYTRAKIEKKKRVKKSIILANFGTEILGQWYPQDIIGRATLFDIFACAANQKPGGGGGVNAFQPGHFPFGPQNGAFYRGQFVIRPGVLVIVVSY